METLWKWMNLLLAFLLIGFCKGFPINLEDNSSGYPQFLTGVAAILVIVGTIILAGCLCCQRRKGFQEFHNTPMVVSTVSNADHGHVNPMVNGEFTIFTPLQLPNLNNSPFIGKSQAVDGNLQDFACGDLDVRRWYESGIGNFPRAKLKYIRELGNGRFGKVVEGAAQNLDPDKPWTPVVVKILDAISGPRNRVLFLHDTLFYLAPPHPNLLALKGSCLDSTPLLFIHEFCTGGDLKSKLRSSGGQDDMTLQWCCQLTSAVRHLHDHGFVHPDLASRNCLLTENLVLKLGDYGLGATKYPEDYYKGGEPLIPVRWQSPESLDCTPTTITPRPLTVEANVWSLGVVMWEICENGAQPYGELNDDEVVSKVFGPENYRLTGPSKPQLYSDYLFRLMRMCWSTAESRPKASQIDLMLSDLLQVHLNTRDPLEGAAASEFDKRWEALKPNIIVKTDNHSTDSDKVRNSFHGSLDRLLSPNLAESKHPEEKLEFKLGLLSNTRRESPPGQLDSFTDSLIFKQQGSSESDTEEENWRRKVERGAYSEKVRLKSRSVADLMVLTHVDYSESESETPLPSLGYRPTRKSNLESVNFSSEGNLLNIEDDFQKELKQLQVERRDSLLFVPDRNNSNLSLLQELNSPRELKPINQIYNIFNVTVNKFHPEGVKLREIIDLGEDGRAFSRQDSENKSDLGYATLHNSERNSDFGSVDGEQLLDDSKRNLPDILTSLEREHAHVQVDLLAVNESLETKASTEESQNVPDLHSENVESSDSVNSVLSRQRRHSGDVIRTCVTGEVWVDTSPSSLETDGGVSAETYLKVQRFISEEKNNVFAEDTPKDRQKRAIFAGIREEIRPESSPISAPVGPNIGSKDLSSHVGESLLKSEEDGFPSNGCQLGGTHNDLEEFSEAATLENLELTPGNVEVEDQNVFTSLTGNSSLQSLHEHSTGSALNVTQLVLNVATLENPELTPRNEAIKDETRATSSVLRSQQDLFSATDALLDDTQQNQESILDVDSLENLEPTPNDEEDEDQDVLTSLEKDFRIQSRQEQLSSTGGAFDATSLDQEQIPEVAILENSELTPIIKEIRNSSGIASPVLGSQQQQISPIDGSLDVTTQQNLKQILEVNTFDNSELTTTNEEVQSVVASPQKDSSLKSQQEPLSSMGDSFDVTQNQEQIVEVTTFENSGLIPGNEEVGDQNVVASQARKSSLQSPQELSCSTLDVTQQNQELFAATLENPELAARNEEIKDQSVMASPVLESQQDQFFSIDGSLDVTQQSSDHILKAETPELTYKNDNLPSETDDSLNLTVVTNKHDVASLTRESLHRSDQATAPDHFMDLNRARFEEESPELTTQADGNLTQVLSPLAGQSPADSSPEDQTRRVEFDLSESQQGPKSNPAYFATSTPFGKKCNSLQRNSSLPGVNLFEDNRNMFSSNFTDSPPEAENKLNYSLETWDSFLGKSFDSSREDADNFFDSFTSEPQSMVFVDAEAGGKPTAAGDTFMAGNGKATFVKNGTFEVSPSEKTFEVKDKTFDVVDRNDGTFVLEPRDNELGDQTTERWEAGGGWFLHPQSQSNSAEVEPQPGTSKDSYIRFGVDDDVMTAIRNELLEKLPQAQGGAQETVTEDETWDQTERNEVFLRYNVYSTPLSPIPEESSILDDETITISERKSPKFSDTDSDWSEPLDNQNPILSSITANKPDQNTPSQGSCCSNDTLFNFEDFADKEHQSADDDVFNEVCDEATLKNCKESANEVEIFLNNERNHSITCSGAQSSCKVVAPLPSPEDNPWKSLPASLLSYDSIPNLIPEDSSATEELLYETVPGDATYDKVASDEEEDVTVTNFYDVIVDKDKPLDDDSLPHDYDTVEDEGRQTNVYQNVDDDEETEDYNHRKEEDSMLGILTDIRFSGPIDHQLMSTSFSESNDADEQEWDSGSDTRSSSSGEFIWKEGEHEESLKALKVAPIDLLEDVQPMEGITEEDTTESDLSTSSSDEEGDNLEFVPSAWDKFATPTKSALRSPDKTLERSDEPSPVSGKKSKGVWFKKQKYHCVYEYPREPDSPILQSQDLWKPQLDYVAFTGTSTHPDTDFIPSSPCGAGTVLDANPTIYSQFFPGASAWIENVTPDSGLEDSTPETADFADKLFENKEVLPLSKLAAQVVVKNKEVSTKGGSKDALGGLRHTRNKLKLDLPPSPSAFTSAKTFAIDEPMQEPEVLREKPTFTTFGKSRFLVQHVDTPPTDGDSRERSKNVCFDVLPYKPLNFIPSSNNNNEAVSYEPLKGETVSEGKRVGFCKGEANLLDSADEDSGIESSTLERKSATTVPKVDQK